MPIARVAFVTSEAYSTLSADDRLAVDALGSIGVAVEPAVWTDPAARWGDFDLVVIRSPWDYHRRAEEFGRWLDKMVIDGIPLWNPADLVRWNADKASYLREMEDVGIPVVPTEVVARGRPLELASILERRGWDEVVVKPAVSASAWGTSRESRSTVAEADAKAAEMLRAGSLLVQPFVPEIATAGEWSLIFLGGRFSHAVLKRPAAGDFRVQNDHGGSAEAASPPPHLVAAAERALSAVRAPWLYARVDGVESTGRFLLMELEMIEPSLFLAHSPDAPQAFADAIVRVLERGRAEPALTSVSAGEPARA
jgi:glutathione synthase/RimK-type ligase-like ATP-grasp enzyme